MNKLGFLLFKNTATNYVMLAVKMISAIFITRIMFLNLGDLYGFWSLLWAVFGYSLFLDFGFGRTVQKYTAESGAENDMGHYSNIVSAVFWTYVVESLLIIAATGVMTFHINDIFKLEGKVDIPHAPFTGAGPATQAVLGSHIPLASVALSAAVQNVQAGQVKGLAVTSKDRVKALPNVPTARELGLGEADDTTWVVFFVPAKTPDAVIEKINADVNAILKDKDTEAQLEKIGFMPVGGSVKEAGAYVQSETSRWGDIIRRVGLEPK